MGNALLSVFSVNLAVVDSKKSYLSTLVVCVFVNRSRFLPLMSPHVSQVFRYDFAF